MNFNKLAITILAPILILFRFELKQFIKGIIKYENDYITIIISYDYNASYEVDITLVFKESGSFYGYNELKQYFYNDKFNFSATQIKDETALINWLEEVNKFLKENLNSIIQNYREVQIRLESIRQHQIDRYENERNSKLLNEGVEKYWMTKDYSGLVRFLKSYKGELMGSIRKKYEFALKMINER